MLLVSPISNVKNTINNRNINFTSGERRNQGADVINETPDIKHEGSFLADFAGAVKQSPLFYKLFMERQESIENGLNIEKTKLNAIA